MIWGPGRLSAWAIASRKLVLPSVGLTSSRSVSTTRLRGGGEGGVLVRWKVADPDPAAVAVMVYAPAVALALAVTAACPPVMVAVVGESVAAAPVVGAAK